MSFARDRVGHSAVFITTLGALLDEGALETTYQQHAEGWGVDHDDSNLKVAPPGDSAFCIRCELLAIQRARASGVQAPIAAHSVVAITTTAVARKYSYFDHIRWD